jgi:2-desacetyl-2-hydroxyethyl bacteriochlorophyllide A dehydrogenase
MTTRLTLFFIAPGQVEVREQPLADPPSGQVLVRTLFSAISPGTESLIYRGLFPQDLPLDENIAALSGGFSYPTKYGYSAVGEVEKTGAGVDRSWLGRLVFAFNPHESHFSAPLDTLHPLPPGITPEQAVFLPNLETAVNFVMDGRPLIGERLLVFGQGIVGLLTTALLSRFPLGRLVTLDRYPLRRNTSLELGAHASLDPELPDLHREAQALLGGEADLCYELSGSPAALDAAIALTGYDGRVVVGSWYGQKRAELDLGGHFHRSRIRLISSQVSTIAPELLGRWDKARRFALAWELLQAVHPERLITHSFPIHAADEAYQLLGHHPEQAIQLVFTYP